DAGHGRARGSLVAHDPNLLTRRADERDLGRRADVRKLRVLGEEPVAWVDRVGAGYFGGGDQPRNVEVRLARWRGADADIVVGEAYVERLAVSLGVDRHGLHAKLAAGADHAQRDLAPIGDQDFAEHQVRVTGRLPSGDRRASPRSTIGAAPPADPILEL